ncbi:hypothetical protein DFJ73DRAFT_759735 [Zopfochytrium polystomum]|nr:hypothetical protein DFJ73DRAFT_759735 [Zopfochytrium polystomum]
MTVPVSSAKRCMSFPSLVSANKSGSTTLNSGLSTRALESGLVVTFSSQMQLEPFAQLSSPRRPSSIPALIWGFCAGARVVGVVKEKPAFALSPASSVVLLLLLRVLLLPLSRLLRRRLDGGGGAEKLEGGAVGLWASPSPTLAMAVAHSLCSCATRSAPSLMGGIALELQLRDAPAEVFHALRGGSSGLVGGGGSGSGGCVTFVGSLLQARESLAQRSKKVWRPTVLLHSRDNGPRARCGPTRGWVNPPSSMSGDYSSLVIESDNFGSGQRSVLHPAMLQELENAFANACVLEDRTVAVGSYLGFATRLIQLAKYREDLGEPPQEGDARTSSPNESLLNDIDFICERFPSKTGKAIAELNLQLALQQLDMIVSVIPLEEKCERVDKHSVHVLAGNRAVQSDL